MIDDNKKSYWTIIIKKNDDNNINEENMNIIISTIDLQWTIVSEHFNALNSHINYYW